MSDTRHDDDYLWDRRGSPEADVERLESALAVFRHRADGRAASRDAVDAVGERRVPRWPLAAAAALVVALGLGSWLAATGDDAAAGWDVAVLEGAPRVGDGRLAPGEAIVTGPGERVRVQVADIGRVDVAPRSSLRLVRTTASEHRIALDRGRIDAFVVAPPRLFLVETPAALAVDLGCAYELDVGDDGSGRLRVTSGWVSLERDGRETIVPEGAVCLLDAARVAPGVPRYEVSPEAFDRALDRVEAGDESAAAIGVLIDEAASHDVLSLWHLIPRVGDAAARRALAEAVASHDPPPDGVTIDAVAALDDGALRAWGDALALGW